MDKDKARRATRKTIVRRVICKHFKRDDPHFPLSSLSRADKGADEAWSVTVMTQNGLRPFEIMGGVFADEAKLDEYLQYYREGREIKERTEVDLLERSNLLELISKGFPFARYAGDEEKNYAYAVLDAAEVYSFELGTLYDEVIETLGQERLAELQSCFKNWEIAAAFEFCFLHLPHSSPAFVAAAYRFHYYITGHEFSAGYHWRDLEVLVHGVEAMATKTITRSQKAGLSGSKKSAEARNSRRAKLWDAIEEFCQRNPDIARMGEDIIVDLALAVAVEKDPALWRQGKGQAKEYLAEIRRGEAGKELQAKYEELFGRKPPKRS